MSDLSKRSLMHDLRVVIAAGGADARRYLALSGIMMVLTSVLDAIGVGAIIPFVAMVSMPDLFTRYPELRDWLSPELVASRSSLILAGAGLFALIYLLRAIVTLCSTWLQAQLQGTLTLHLSDRLYRSYLQRDYAYHLDRGPAYFTARLEDSVFRTRTSIQAFQQLGVEGLTALLIVAIVVLANPVAAAVSLLGMALPTALIYHYLHSRLQVLGQDQHENWEAGNRLIFTGISAIKDIMVFHREQHFCHAYHEQKLEARVLASLTALYSNAPRVLIELATVLALLLLCAAMAWQGRMDELVVVMGLYAAAAFRLMPCANRLLMAMTQIRQSRFGLGLVADDLDAVTVTRPELVAPAPERLPQPFQQLQVRDLVFRYREDLTPALNRLSLDIKAGETVGFVGSSGAGKSSLIDVLLGLLAPESGELLVDGRPLAEVLPSWRRRIGYVPQAIYLIDDTIRRNVAFGMADDEINDRRIWRALEAARLDHFVRGLEQGLDTPVGERGVKLSGGQRQRIGIARALYHQPDILILDEATSALDNATEAEFMQAIDALHGEKTILMVAHRLTTVRNCDRIIVMQHGQVIDQGNYDHLVASSDVFRRIGAIPD